MTYIKYLLCILSFVQVTTFCGNDIFLLTDSQKTDIIMQMFRNYNVQGGEKTWKQNLHDLLESKYDPQNELRMQIFVLLTYKHKLFVKKWSYDEIMNAFGELNNIIKNDSLHRYYAHEALEIRVKTIVHTLKKYHTKLKQYKGLEA